MNLDAQLYLSVLTGLSMPTVSHYLREQGFVDSRREGKLVFCQLVDEDVRLLFGLGSKLVETGETEEAAPEST